MNLHLNRRHAVCILSAALLAASVPAVAQKRYDTGASDTEIKIGNIGQYSGPVSAYSTIVKSAGAYFAKVNAEGGVNGRKINYISLDDGFVPAKSVEQTRKLVEQEKVFAMFLPIGTSPSFAIQKYLNAKKVPQLFVGTGATRFGDIKQFPWTIGWQPTYYAEAKAYAEHILAKKSSAKVAVLQANDDFGKDFMTGLVEGLGARAKDLVVQTYETSDPTIDSQVLSLKGSGADTFIILGTPRFATMALKKAHEIGWSPARYVSSVSQSVGSVMRPAGEGAKGAISVSYMRDPTDPGTQATPEYADYAAFMKQYYPAGDPTDSLNVLGYSAAQTLVQTLKQAGDNLTRENVMRQALNLDMKLPMLYSGIEVKTGPGDAYPIEKLQLIQFNGSRYEPLGALFGGR